MKLKIEKDEDSFVVRDENGTVYGPQVSTHREAEELLKDWKTYYSEFPE